MQGNFDEEYRNRIAQWLAKYIDIHDCRYGYGSDKVIRQGIRLLLNEVFITREALKKDALKYGGIILTDKILDEILNT